MGRPKTNKTEKKDLELMTCNCKDHRGKNPLSVGNFYSSKSPMFGNGKVPVCKKCIANMIDYNNMQTLYDVFQLMDVPYFYNRWYEMVEKNPDNPLGNYLRMANSGLNEFNGARWKDSQFDSSKTSKDNKNSVLDTDENKNKLEYNEEWRGTYNESDLNYLEEYYKDLNRDFKIVTRNHKDYARKIAKASLAMDRAYDDMVNGIQGSDTRYKNLKDTFDQLSKSAQFAEDKRGANEVGLGCFGVTFAKVEKHNWIPNHVPLEKDDIDKMIEAFGVIDKSL